MRVQNVVLIVAALAVTDASASSIEALVPSANTPSILAAADSRDDPSIEAVPDLVGPAHSVVALANTPVRDTPDVITLGGPAPDDEADAAGSGRLTPTVIRGGEAGDAFARPSPAQASAPTAEPLLDPNDRGTPAKRKALKRQAERLAREKAAAGQSAEPDESSDAAPLGQ
jgi:hypothetical protein